MFFVGKFQCGGRRAPVVFGLGRFGVVFGLTNDLDISTLTILEDYLKDFPGILVTVSHDRYFLDKLAGRIFAFEGNGKISQYEGNFSDYKTACRIKQAELTQDHSKEKNAKNSKAEKPDCTQVQSENNTKTTQTKNNWRTPSTTLKFWSI